MPAGLVLLLVLSFVGLVALMLYVFGTRQGRGRREDRYSTLPPEPPSAAIVPVQDAAPIDKPATKRSVTSGVPQNVQRDMTGIGLESGAGRYLPKPLVTEDAALPICPNCKRALEKRPKRKSACPLCGETIFVKYTPTDPVKRLVNAARLAEIEVEWAAYHEKKERQRIDAEAAIFGIPPGLSNDEIVAGMKAFAENPKNELHLRGQAASLVARSSSGRERAKWATNRYRLDLEGLMESGFSTVTLRGGSDPCSSCRTLVGKMFSTAEAKAKYPVPNRKCYRWKEHGDCCAFWGTPKM